MVHRAFFKDVTGACNWEILYPYPSVEDVAGAEGMLRWDHAIRYPGFLPLFEAVFTRMADEIILGQSA